MVEREKSSQKELEEIKKELDEYKEEKERVREILGGIGGKTQSKKSKLFNYLIIAAMVIFFVGSLVFHWIDALIALEVGVLLVSIKIIWMMNHLEKVSHFQFWILTSLEYKVNEMQKKLVRELKAIKKRLPEEVQERRE